MSFYMIYDHVNMNVTYNIYVMLHWLLTLSLKNKNKIEIKKKWK